MSRTATRNMHPGSSKAKNTPVPNAIIREPIHRFLHWFTHFLPTGVTPCFYCMHFFPLCVWQQKTGISENIRNPCFVYKLDSIGVSPDFLLIRCRNEFIPEIRMCQRNKQFRSFPCASACQIHNAIFCYDIERLCSGGL